MTHVEVSSIGAAISNEKRLFILKMLTKHSELSWSQIVKYLDEEYSIRVNPNTVSFHLKYLLDRNIIERRGNLYRLTGDEQVKRRIVVLVN